MLCAVVLIKDVEVVGLCHTCHVSSVSAETDHPIIKEYSASQSDAYVNGGLHIDYNEGSEDVRL